MAGEDRKAADRLALARALRETPYLFDFFQVVRRLECLHDDRPRVGRTLRAEDDAFRFAQEPSLGFAPSTIASFEADREGFPPRLAVLFFGLFGPNGPLPLHLTEHARERLRNHRDPTLARFADVFHHRMLSLFYRAWATAQPTVQYDRPTSDRFAGYMGALVGIGMPSHRNRDALPDLARFHFAGRLGASGRNPEGLEAMLSGFFRMPARVVEFVGHWVGIPAESRSRLGLSREGTTLGRTAMLGNRFWDAQMKFRVVLGPMGLQRFRRLLPGGPGLSQLAGVVRSYAGDELEWDLSTILRREEVPPTTLGERSQLGWTTWLLGRPPSRDADDLVLDPIAQLRRWGAGATTAPEPMGAGVAS